MSNRPHRRDILVDFRILEELGLIQTPINGEPPIHSGVNKLNQYRQKYKRIDSITMDENNARNGVGHMYKELKDNSFHKVLFISWIDLYRGTFLGKNIDTDEDTKPYNIAYLLTEKEKRKRLDIL